MNNTELNFSRLCGTTIWNYSTDDTANEVKFSSLVSNLNNSLKLGKISCQIHTDYSKKKPTMKYCVVPWLVDQFSIFLALHKSDSW